MSLRVVKVGGSLFEWPKFKTRVKRWLDSVHQPSRIVILAGGGKYVDKVRRWQVQYGWTDERAHKRALDMLRVTSRLMKNWLRDAVWIDNPVQIKFCTDRIVVLDCSRWASQIANLPQDWNLTSDSLSAILATQLDASELVLLKSRLPHGDDPRQDRELIDPHFENYAGTRVRIVNLRCPLFSERVYRTVSPHNDVCASWKHSS